MDKTVRVWENSVRGESRVLKHHTGAVRCIDISSDDSMLLSCSDDKTIKVIPL
jgi:WD40 repeat protein